jgi:hypothetical protein
VLRIPDGLLTEDLMESLEIGHGYRWTKLVVSPKLWAHGNPPSSDLPEVLIIGKKILLEDGETHSLRFNRMLQALNQRSHLTGGRRRE